MPEPLPPSEVEAVCEFCDAICAALTTGVPNAPEEKTQCKGIFKDLVDEKLTDEEFDREMERRYGKDWNERATAEIAAAAEGLQ